MHQYKRERSARLSLDSDKSENLVTASLVRLHWLGIAKLVFGLITVIQIQA
jgi:hypothetical protein